MRGRDTHRDSYETLVEIHTREKPQEHREGYPKVKWKDGRKACRQSSSGDDWDRGYASGGDGRVLVDNVGSQARSKNMGEET